MTENGWRCRFLCSDHHTCSGVEKDGEVKTDRAIASKEPAVNSSTRRLDAKVRGVKSLWDFL